MGRLVLRACLALRDDIPSRMDNTSPGVVLRELHTANELIAGRAIVRIQSGGKEHNDAHHQSDGYGVW